MKLGVLLINTGTPDAPEIDAIKPYLREFLMDPAIIGAPYPVRRALVEHIVRNRPARTVKHYKAFWTDAGSPFLLESLAQRDALQERLEQMFECGAAEHSKCERERSRTPKRAQSKRDSEASVKGACENVAGNQASKGKSSERGAADSVRVELAMRYGNPSIASGLAKLRDAGCTHLVLLPAYPQNVNVCAGTCLREARAQLEKLTRAKRPCNSRNLWLQRARVRNTCDNNAPWHPRVRNTCDNNTSWNPRIYEVLSFHERESYREALAESVVNHWRYTPSAKLAVSFHSTMMRDIKRDPTYLQQTKQTKDWLAHDLQDAIGMSPEDVTLCFQSRFDTRKWLQPFTEQVIKAWVRQGVTNICVVCPGFVADNIETAVEVNQGLRETVCEHTTYKKANLHSLRETVRKQANHNTSNLQATKKRSRDAVHEQAISELSGTEDANICSCHTVNEHVNKRSAQHSQHDILHQRKTPLGHISQNTTDVLQEIASGNSGKVSFTYVPALGTHAGLIDAMAGAVRDLVI